MFLTAHFHRLAAGNYRHFDQYSQVSRVGNGGQIRIIYSAGATNIYPVSHVHIYHRLVAKQKYAGKWSDWLTRKSDVRARAYPGTRVRSFENREAAAAAYTADKDVSGWVFV